MVFLFHYLKYGFILFFVNNTLPQLSNTSTVALSVILAKQRSRKLSWINMIIQIFCQSICKISRS
jgi:hypothetical protein